MQYTPRFHFIDNLRSTALILGVIFHTALAYGPYFKNIWLSADPSNSVFFDVLSNWLHLFRMPLFFVIAGFCSALIIQQNSTYAFIKLRLKRILIPFIIFFPLLAASFVHVLTWGADIADPVPAIFTVFKVIKTPLISTMHLWFLWLLMQLCLLHWVIMHISTRCQYLCSVFAKPIIACLAIATLSFAALLGQPVPFPAPDKIQPQLWGLVFYGAFYVMGIGFHHKPYRLECSIKTIILTTIIALISVSLYLTYLPEPPTLEQVIEAAKQGSFTPTGWRHMRLVAIQAVAIVSWTVLVLQLGYLFLNRANRLSRYLSEASYWVYLVHVPLLLYIQFPLINLDLPVFAKFTISLLATLSSSLFTYHFLVRGRFLGHLLNGKKKPEYT
ncbi:acyltransferase family protein [Pseudoalteromonas sp. Of7M-16]|uniref:acyltransferase family protein n=1 Tax=Pseudoalteromonas sp. Of7M-16 TaxID=2917756 RepID=UPI001EF565AC|nr:acyltransferase family protein [Pseudoalteromonas sp. Of7M-16]MCG7546615.1 acyltransferase family protein [Pseudoalteromonas sp. Of7M-16]